MFAKPWHHPWPTSKSSEVVAAAEGAIQSLQAANAGRYQLSPKRLFPGSRKGATSSVMLESGVRGL